MNNIKKKVFDKKFLYMLCFIAFMLIDWTRGSQVGSTWAWTVNMTGVVMAIILLSAYHPKEFAKPVYMVYSVICIAILWYSYYWWNLHQAVIYRDKLLTAVLNIWLLGIFVIKMFLDTAIYKTKCLRLSKTELLAGVMLLWMLFSKNEDIWPIWYLVMFGLFYHTEYSEEELKSLKEGMLNGIIAAFFMLQGAAFVFRPFDDPHHRYCGIYANCNINAMFYGIVWIAFLIKLFDIRRNGDKKWKELLCLIFAGALMAFSILTISKTAWISMGTAGLFYVIFADFHCLEYKAGKMLKKLALYLVVVLVCIPVVYGAARYFPPIFHHPIWYEGEYSEDRVHSWDPWNSEKYVSWDELAGSVSARILPYIRVILGNYQGGISTVKAAEMITIAGKSYEKELQVVEDFASIQGRVDYWKYYLKNGTMVGHSSSEGHDIGLGFYVWHAQNIFVQFWYYYGIPSAILFIIVLVMLILKSMKSMIKKKDRMLICLLYLLFFGVFGLFEATWYPGQVVLFLAFFVPRFLPGENDRMHSGVDLDEELTKRN